MKKLLIDVLMCACLVAVVYTSYRLFADSMDIVPGVVITVVGVFVLIAGWRLLKRPARRIGGGILIVYMTAVAVIACAAGAYGGVKPLAEAKDTVTGKIQDIAENIGGESIVGEWECSTSPHKMELMEDGVYLYDDGMTILTGVYELIGEDYIKVTLDGFAGAWQYLFEEDTVRYEMDGDVLTTYSEGETVTFHRIK